MQITNKISSLYNVVISFIFLRLDVQNGNSDNSRWVKHNTISIIHTVTFLSSSNAIIICLLCSLDNLTIVCELLVNFSSHYHFFAALTLKYLPKFSWITTRYLFSTGRKGWNAVQMVYFPNSYWILRGTLTWNKTTTAPRFHRLCV